MAVWDVAQGYRTALAARGHHLRDFAYNKRLQYHGKAIGPCPDPTNHDIESRHRHGIMKMASETIVIEALYHHADAVVIVCGLNFNPIGGWLLKRVGIPVVVVLTESPYEDESQATFVREVEASAVTTNERLSAAKYGWTYLRHAYDPDVHKPSPPDLAYGSDVLLVGTGWADRQRWLEQVDWTGIQLRLLGVWPTMRPSSPLWPFYTETLVENSHLPRLYAATKIALNIHRGHPHAESLNPRAFEIAACGACQVTDYRAELTDVFGDSVPSVRTAVQLGDVLRRYLCDHDARHRLARDAQEKVMSETFAARVLTLESVLYGVVH